MDFTFTDEQSLLQRIVRDFARQELLPRYTHWDRTGEFPSNLWRQMGGLGLTGTRVPRAYDGQEMDAVTTGIAAEEVARGDFNLAYAVLMPALCGEVLAGHASERVKREWLAPMARGEAVLGLALTEPGAGSDARMIRTRAVRDGDDYVITGEKSGISLLMAAHALVLFAKTDPEAGARGVTAFLVPTERVGITRTPLRRYGQPGDPARQHLPRRGARAGRLPRG